MAKKKKKIDQSPLWDGFLDWVEKNHIQRKDFAEKTGYATDYTGKLFRGDVVCTPTTLGRILVGYGLEAAAEITRRKLEPKAGEKHG